MTFPQTRLRAKRLARLLTIIGSLLSVHCFFFVSSKWFLQTPYTPTILVLIFFPLMVMLVARLSRGHILFMDYEKKDQPPTVFLAFLVPALIVGIRSMMDWNLYNPRETWLRSLLLASILVTLIAYGNREFLSRKKDMNWFIVFLVMSLGLLSLGGGGMVLLNCTLDNGKPAVFEAEVLDKWQSGKSHTPYVKLTPWHTLKDSVHCNPTLDQYTEIEVGDKVEVLLRSGRLGYPWYEIRLVEPLN